MPDRNTRLPFLRLVRTRIRAFVSVVAHSRLWRTGPVFLICVASGASAASAALAFDAKHAPVAAEAASFGAAVEMLTSEYEFHQPTNTSRNQQFGGQVALSADGRTLAVADVWYFGGSQWPWYGSGAVYVYGRSAGRWLLQAKLEPTDPRGYDFFGSDLALSTDGRTLAIGSQNEGYDAPSQDAGPGSVFVFTRHGGLWSQQAVLRATNPQDAAWFGRSIEISGAGNVLAVGAPYESGSADGSILPATGAVYVFRRRGHEWTPQAALQAPNPQSHDLFGLGVRLSDNGRTLAVLAAEQNWSTEGAGYGDWPNRNNTVYVFGRTAGDWSLQAQIEGSVDDPLMGGNSYEPEGQVEGFDLSADGRTLAVASPFAPGPDHGAGVVRLYERTGDFWSPSRVALAPSLPDRSKFAVRLTLSADGRTLAATAHRNEGPYGRPYVVVFSRRGGQWTERSLLESPAWPNSSSFGDSLTLSRTAKRLVIGSRLYATDNSTWGVVFVY